MLTEIGRLAQKEKCAVYNDLSHINPRYLTPQGYEQAYYEREVQYHKHNILLLTLYFDRVIICTDNISAFTRYLAKDVVAAVVQSTWFKRLVDEGIVILAGWGSSISAKLMDNQINYSSTFRPELKDGQYNSFLGQLSESATWVVREESTGEEDLINFLRPLVLRSEGILTKEEIGFTIDLMEKTQALVGYVGTMEMFPHVDDRLGHDPIKSDAYYSLYYASWHSYCAKHYAPAIPIQTSKINLPTTWIDLAEDGGKVLSTLYAPELFRRFLQTQFGSKRTAKLMSVEINDLLDIRNGDWARFKAKYHTYLHAASEICWIANHADQNLILREELILDQVIAEIFNKTDDDTDISALAGVLDVALGAFSLLPVLSPIAAIFRGRINKKFGNLAHSIIHRELEPYLKKLGTVLESPTATA